MKKTLIKTMALLCLLLCLSAYAQEKVDPVTKFQRVFHSITAEEIGGYMDMLTSEEFNGRLTGTPGYEKSAKWVASRLKAWGLKPMGDEGSYFQMFDKPYVVVKDPGSLSVVVKGEKEKFSRRTISIPIVIIPAQILATVKLRERLCLSDTVFLHQNWVMMTMPVLMLKER
jgi:hypothetical protein